MNYLSPSISGFPFFYIQLLIFSLKYELNMEDYLLFSLFFFFVNCATINGSLLAVMAKARSM